MSVNPTSKLLRALSYLFELVPESRSNGKSLLGLSTLFFSISNITDSDEISDSQIEALKSILEIIILLSLAHERDMSDLNLFSLLQSLSTHSARSYTSLFSLLFEIIISQLKSNFLVQSCFDGVPGFFNIFSILANNPSNDSSDKLKSKLHKLIGLIVCKPGGIEAIEMLDAVALIPLVESLESVVNRYLFDDNYNDFSTALSLILLLFESSRLRTRLVDCGVLYYLVQIQLMKQLTNFRNEKSLNITNIWIQCVKKAAQDSAIRYRLKFAAFKPFCDVSTLDTSLLGVSPKGIIPIMYLYN